MSVEQGDVLSVVLKQQFAGVGEVQNIFHMQYADAVTLDNETAVDEVGSWIEKLLAQMDDVQSTSIAYSQVIIYNVTQDQPVGIYTPVLTNGTVVGDYLPSGVAGLITKFSGEKKRLGKTFLAGLVEAAITSGIIEAGTVSAIEDIADLLIGLQTGSTANFQMVLWNKLKNVVPYLSEYAVRAIPAYQRRRKYGVGS